MKFSSVVEEGEKGEGVVFHGDVVDFSRSSVPRVEAAARKKSVAVEKLHVPVLHPRCCDGASGRGALFGRDAPSRRGSFAKAAERYENPVEKSPSTAAKKKNSPRFGTDSRRL